MTVPYLIGDPYLDANFAYLTGSGAPTGVFSGAVSTTNAAQATLCTIAVPANSTLVIMALVAARRTGGSSGATGDGAGYNMSAVVKNIAGTVSVISQGVTFSGEDQPTWDATLTVSGTNVLIRITGAANNTVNWTAVGQTLGAT